MTELPPKIAEVLARRGVDPKLLDEPPPPEFDVVAFRLEQAQKLLNRAPARFRQAKATAPGIVEWVEQFLDAPSQAPSLLVTGPTGVGKTTQCWGALRACAEGVAATGRALYWRTTTYPDFNAAMRPSSGNDPEATLAEFMTIDLLFLDDLGSGTHTEWNNDNLYRLVDARWADQKPTIYSTNLLSAALGERVGDRVLSRLASAKRVALVGDDHRWTAA